MTDWTEFIKCQRGLLLAPAGHGKTTAIADCLLQCSEKSCQLILTHTHAGIASLRKKFQQKNIPSSKYQLETITGFAQRYVLGFLGSSVLPDETDKNYFSAAIEKCNVLMQSKLVQTVIQSSYDGVFVDEYQDCTIDQHNMIMELAYDLPLHILGDPLQGIFSFESKPLVNFDKDLGLFTRFDNLCYPWRWHDSNRELGQEILHIRKCLENQETINLQNNPNIGLFVVALFEDEQENFRKFATLLENHDSDSLLVICPSYREMDRYGRTVLKGKLNDRITIKQRIDYRNRLTIIDAIDSGADFSCARKIDTFVEQCITKRNIKRIARFYDILSTFHINMTELNKWIDKKGNRFIPRKKNNALYSAKMLEKFSNFETSPTLETLQDLIAFVISLPGIKKYHRDLYSLINKSFKIAHTNNISMLEAMKRIKDRMRHQGRKIQGRIIGTTLLTKGLEFDTVFIWNAHKFEDAKNFYVAISRACKKLILLTSSNVIQLKK
ncbi:MAG: UvrD-helicase domain-containing protein [Bacteroidaceae bacterium]|nr:UvrD-helicase domain-containing protein [Bacteroidaceae bacterium]